MKHNISKTQHSFNEAFIKAMWTSFVLFSTTPSVVQSAPPTLPSIKKMEGKSSVFCRVHHSVLGFSFSIFLGTHIEFVSPIPVIIDSHMTVPMPCIFGMMSSILEIVAFHTIFPLDVVFSTLSFMLLMLTSIQYCLYLLLYSVCHHVL
jgi:hypothetical protein